MFLAGYIIISLAEIFSVGEFPLPDSVRIVRRVPHPVTPFAVY
jgi:hypothetical protein